MQLSQSAIEMAPPFSLVSKFFITAALFLGVTLTAMPMLAFYDELSIMAFEVAGFIHLYFLGFVMMIIIGALYQLIPVVLEVPFSTLKGSNAVFFAYTLGSLGLSCGMMLGDTTYMHAGAGLVYVALTYFTSTFLCSFLKVRRWTLVSLYLLLAGVLLLGAITLGMLLLLVMTGVNIEMDVMHLLSRHVAFAIGGFVMLIVMGVSLVLLPMFSLAHDFSTLSAKLGLVVMGLGFMLGIFSSQDHWMWLCMSIGIVLYITQALHIFKHRMRKKNDYWVGNVMTSYLFLFFSLVFGLWGYIETHEGWIKIAFFLGAVGFGYHFVMGHMYKILPFLIWYRYISPLVGKQKVPMLHEMIDERAAYVQMWLGIIGVILMSVGLAFPLGELRGVGGIILGASSWAALYNVWFAYRFKYQGVKE